jgi:hypothetical protein
MEETKHQKLARLLQEIADRQAQVQYLVCGDPRECVSGESFVSTRMNPLTGLPDTYTLKE